MISKITDVVATQMACALPKTHIAIGEYAPTLFDKQSIRRIVQSTGFEYLHIAPPDMTTSDLVVAAADDILQQHPRDNIKAVLFVSQTPDYTLPATSHVIQERLNLPNDIICLDVNEGCSGYVRGLYIAGLLCQQLHGDVLLLVGDTVSKLTSPDDRSTRCLFGDAGTATLLSQGKTEMLFSFASYGQQAELIIAGDSHGRAVGQELAIDGVGVMNFALGQVSALVSRFLTDCNMPKDSISLFAFHQANKLIISLLADKLDLDPDKLPFVASNTGNTSSASIPLLLSQYSGKDTLKRVLCCGFGVGLSIGVCLADFSQTIFSEVKEI